MKALDAITFILLIVGALNWGLVGLFNFDLVAKIFGSMSVISRIIYVVVAICGIYHLLLCKSISKRWAGKTTM